jgi:hypothetical protein
MGARGAADRRDAWVFEDPDSRNGSFLGAQRTGRVEITGDCEVRLGNPENGPVLHCQPQVRTAALSSNPRCPH